MSKIKTRTVEIARIDRDRPVNCYNHSTNRVTLAMEPPAQRLYELLATIDAQTKQAASVVENVGVNQYHSEVQA
jgi:hypothetical protein